MVFQEVFEAKAPPEWATYCEGRKPSFKVHTSLGLAHSAIAFHKPHFEIALYHLEVEDGKPVWKKAWEYTYPDRCPNCDGTFKYRMDYRLSYEHQGTVKEAPVVCKDCWNKEYKRVRAEEQAKCDRAELERLRSLYPEA